MAIKDLAVLADQIIDYEHRLKKSELDLRLSECNEKAKQYEIEAMYDSLLEQEKIHMMTIQLLQLIIDNVPNMPIFWKGLDGKYLGCNAAFESISGISRYYALGKTSDELYSGSYVVGSETYPPNVFNESDELCKKHGRYTYDFEFCLVGGRCIPATFHKILFYDVENNPYGIVTFVDLRCATI